MQSFDTEPNDVAAPSASGRKVIVGAIGDLQSGACARIQLPDGAEIAVYKVDGEFYAIDNSCPHRGAPLSEGMLCGHVIECGLHGWQFDVRNGEGLTFRESIKSYKLEVEEGVLKVEV